MKMKVVLIVAGILAVIVIFFLIRAANKQNIQMNNQTCPVSGNPVNKNYAYIHEGKEYNLCSDQCKQSIAENPKQYLFD